jgi:serine/threonine-protein kinase
MDRRSFTEIRRLVEELVDLSLSARAERLETIEDPDLRTEILDLLSREAESDDFLRSPWSGAAASLVSHERAERLVGKRLGPWRIVELLALGGMGAVYRAERDDAEYDLEVAIKVLDRSFPGDGAQKAFQRERQLLADLEHPGICRLLDGGTTSDGSPFAVLELVRGKPLLDHCRDVCPSRRERLRLFLEICSAVDAAHRSLVLHRDLKPSNVLVTEQGYAKVIDFGIAGFVDEKDAVRAYSPDFASPEQMRGETLTTSSDVFSLGKILAALLPGEVPEELASILARATREESTSRYASVEALAADVSCFLEGRPVLAHDGGRFYRTRKLVRRHGIVVFGSAAAFVAVSTLALLAALLAQRLDRERVAAVVAGSREEQARALTERINAFLVDTLATARPDRLGGDATVLEALEETEARIESELSSDPEMAARVRMSIADTYASLGLGCRAEPHLRSALALFRQVTGPASREVIDTLTRLGGALSYQGDPEGLPLQEEALGLLLSRGDATPLEVAEAHHALGFALYRCARPPRFAEAERCIEKAIEGYRDERGDDAEFLGVGLHALAALRLRSGRLEESLATYEEALSLHEHAGDLGTAGAIELRVDRASCLVECGRAEEALAELASILEESAPRFGITFRAWVLGVSGDASLARARPDEAAQQYKEALALRCKSIARRGILGPSAEIALEQVAADLLAIASPRTSATLPGMLQEIPDLVDARFAEAEAIAGLLLGLTRCIEEDPVAIGPLRRILEHWSEERTDVNLLLAEVRVELGHRLSLDGASDEGTGLLEKGARELGLLLGDRHPRARRARYLQGLAADQEVARTSFG